MSAFIVLFVLGSAALLTLAFVGVPGAMIGWGGSAFGSLELAWYWPRYGIAIAVGFLLMLLIGSFLSAVQLSNAEDWVSARFKGRALREGEAADFASAVHDMSLAAGLPAPPKLVVLDAPGVNAFALGASRKAPSIGVTSQFLASLPVDEQRAVAATLIARICAGDIMFATALAALMGPLKAIRESKSGLSGVADGCAAADPSCVDGCADSGGCITDGLSDSDSASGCLGALGIALFIAVTIALTYAAVVAAAWLVTLWGRALHRTAYEKADAEGMLLLKDARPMLSALRSCVETSNEVLPGDDPSYDGIFYAATSGRPGVDARERRRYERLREVLSTEGIAAPPVG